MNNFTKYIAVTAIQFCFFYVLSQAQGEVFKLSKYGYDQIVNRTHLERHFIDSTSGLYGRRIRSGKTIDLTDAQLKLGYFSLMINDTIVWHDEFLISEYNTLVPGMVMACEEFGFYKFIHVFDGIENHRSKNISVFQSDTAKVLFDENSDNFDYKLNKLRGKLVALCDNFHTKGIYLDRIRNFIIEHKNEICE